MSCNASPKMAPLAKAYPGARDVPPPRTEERAEQEFLKRFQRSLELQHDKLHLMVDCLRDSLEETRSVKGQLREVKDLLAQGWGRSEKLQVLNTLQVCQQKLHSIEFRQCADSPEYAAAARFTEQHNRMIQIQPRVRYNLVYQCGGTASAQHKF